MLGMGGSVYVSIGSESVHVRLGGWGGRYVKCRR